MLPEPPLLSDEHWRTREGREEKSLTTPSWLICSLPTPRSTVTEIIDKLELDWNKIYLVENLINGIAGTVEIITVNSDQIEDENNLKYDD